MTTNTLQQVVFIDCGIPNLQDLLNGLTPGEAAFVIDPSSDGLDQIADILAANNFSDLASLSIVAHGADGEIALGSSLVTSANLPGYSTALAKIGAALQPGGNIQLYGCDVAQDAAGQQFIDNFSTLAGGAAVEAATGLVGSLALGGSWTLGASSGPSPAAVSPPFTTSALTGFQGQLITAAPETDLFFSTLDNTSGEINPDLYRVDSSGTPHAMPINPPNGSSAGEDGGFVNFNGDLFFNAFTPSAGDALVTLTSPTGTPTVVTDGGGDAFGTTGTNANFAVIGGSLYFESITINGDELVKLNSDGTSQAFDFNGNQESFAGANGGFVPFNNLVYFSAVTTTTTGFNPDLIALDPSNGTFTEISTRSNANAQFGSNAGEDGGLIVFNNALYFNATTDTAAGDTLMQLAAGSTTPVAVDPNATILSHESGVSNAFHIYNGDLYFNEFSTSVGDDTLFQLSAGGTPAPLTYQSQPLENAGEFGGFTDFNGSTYFVAGAGVNGPASLFSLNAAGTITQIYTTSGGAFDGNLGNSFAQFDGALYFDAYTSGGDNLFKLAAGSTTPTVVDLGSVGTTDAGLYGGFKEFDNSLYFSAYTSSALQLIKLNADGTFAPIAITGPTSNGNTFAGEYGGFGIFANTTTTATADTASVVQAAQGTGNVLTNDTDSDIVNQALMVTAVSAAGGPPAPLGVPVAGTFGHLTLNQGGGYTYAADNATAIGAAPTGSDLFDAFDYTETDQNGNTSTTTLTITVDRPPATVTHNVAIVENASVGPVSAGDTDPDGDTVTVTALNGGTVGSSDPGTYGALTLNADDTYSYGANNTTAINAAATGSKPVDTFTYTASDGKGGTATETLSFAIDRPPATVTHNVAIIENASVGPVSAGDTDPDGDTVTVTGLNGGTVGSSDPGIYGALTLNADDTYSYSANNTTAIDAAATGSKPVDTFTYTASDGQGGTATETLSFTIDRPPATVTHNVAIVENASVGPVSAGDTDPDGDTVTVTGLNGGTVGSSDPGTYGALTLNADDTYSYSANNTTAIDAAATGSKPVDTFTYTASDGKGGTATETLSFTIDRPPNALAASTGDVEGATVSPAAPGVLTGDIDPDSDTLSVSAVNGLLANVGQSVAGTYGELTLNANGSYTYISDQTAAINSAASGSEPQDVFAFTVNDGHGGTATNNLTIMIDRPPANSVPSGTQTATENTALAFTGPTTISVADPDNQPLSVTLSTSHGNVTLGSTTGLTVTGSNGSHSVTVAGSVTNLNTSLATLSYQGDSNYTGSDTLTVDTTDGIAPDTVSPVALNVVACFCRGTLILTDRGEVAVEELAIADRVVTLSGAPQAIKWIGYRGYDRRFVAGNRAVLPIRFAAGSLGAGLPVRDLSVSPEHALYLDGLLAPARLLVDGTNIVQANDVELVEYFHIELEAHDIILAEGAPTESYVECDNRGMFHNADQFAALYPGDDRLSAQFCVPRVGRDSAELAAIRAALPQRAEPTLNDAVARLACA